jgi:uncharacterized membrane protein
MSRWIVLILVLAMLSVGASLIVWENRADWLPDKVPVHWNALGDVDRVVPRDEMFWNLMIMPLVLVGLAGMAVALPWLSPAHFKIEPFRATYDYIMGILGLMFFYLGVVVLLAYMGEIIDVARWIVGGMLVGLGLLGNVLGKVKRNFWVGVRTPWTLASDVVWERTHRLAAWLFVAGAAVGLVLLLLDFNALIAFAPFVVAALAPVVYSLVLYKRLEKEGRLGNEGEARSA